MLFPGDLDCGWICSRRVLMMEELLVCVLLLCEGFNFEEEYQKTLDKLFMLNPENEVLLNLEFMSNDIKGSCLYLKAHFNYTEFNADKFGQFLMQKLAVLYEQDKLRHFAAKMYSLWQNLPDNISCEEPFWTLCYADDPLSWGDERQCRELYEEMLNYYK